MPVISSFSELFNFRKEVEKKSIDVDEWGGGVDGGMISVMDSRSKVPKVVMDVVTKNLVGKQLIE